MPNHASPELDYNRVVDFQPDLLVPIAEHAITSCRKTLVRIQVANDPTRAIASDNECSNN